MNNTSTSRWLALMDQQEHHPATGLKRRQQEELARFFAGDDRHFSQRHAQVFDEYLRESFARSGSGLDLGLEKNPCAILALGGYGRRELCVRSDIDVVLLFADQIAPQASALVQEIFYPLWDLGLEVGYAVRTLSECLRLAQQDFQVMTSLVDARFLCGISRLHSELLERLQRQAAGRQGNKYVDWLLDQCAARHHRFGDSTHLLEPNLKEGLGGLRDYHAMLWLGWLRFGIRQPRDLEFLGHLSHREYRQLSEAVSFLWRVRNWLHHLAGRKCDQLYFEYQLEVAAALGYQDQGRYLGVEQFLRDLHGHMESLKKQHLLFLARVRPRALKGRPGPSRPRVGLEGIVVGEQWLDFESAAAILNNPYLLVNIFDQSGHHRLPLSIEARRLVQEFLYLVDADFRVSSRVAAALERIMMMHPDPQSLLDEMLNTGLLGTLIPELGRVMNLIQYDDYHLYPVDKHLIRCVQVLRQLTTPGGPEADGLCVQLASEISRSNLLYWAALLHDLGKDRRFHDHAGRGAEICRRVLQRLGLPAADTDTVSFLVAEHLLLAKTATQRDLNDEKVIIECARRFPTSEELKMLYLLSVADAKATGPKAWNDWLAVLLKELFFKVLHILEKGELASPSTVSVIEGKKRQVLDLAGVAESRELETLLEQMSPRYLLYTPAPEMVRHLALYRALGQAPFTLEATAAPDGHYRTVTICAHDRPGLFSRIAGVFTLNDLDIFAAQIYTWRNRVAVDVFQVKPPLDPLFEEDIWERVRSDLTKALAGQLDLENLLADKVRQHQLARRQVGTLRPDRVVIDNHASDFYTVVEIYTYDFPGLLYRVTNSLFQLGLDIWLAKISTKVDQVVDVFYVRDLDGQKVEGPEEIKRLEESLYSTLAGKPSES